MWTAYGPAYSPGDEIICFLDLSRVPGVVSFSLNGKPLGEAFTIPTGKPLFPHLLLKNVSATMDFEGHGMLNGYQPWSVSLAMIWAQHCTKTCKPCMFDNNKPGSHASNLLRYCVCLS